MLTGNGIEVKLIDFGSSQFIQNNEKIKNISASPEYMSPEMIKFSIWRSV